MFRRLAVLLLVVAGCATDSTGAQDPTHIDYFNSTARTDLRVRVQVGPRTIGTYPILPATWKQVDAEFTGGTVVTTTVLDPAGVTVSAGSCTVQAAPFTYAAVVVDPAVTCGCGFEDGSGGEGVPCNP